MRAEENRKFIYLLVAVNIMPHWVELPEWVVGSSLTFVLWRYFSEYYNIPTPNRFLVHLIGLVCGTGVFFEYGTVIGDEASASILVLMVSLKLFEIRGYRDIMIVTILCYFLLMSKLISSQSIAMTVFMLIDLVMITSLLSLHHSPLDQGRWRSLVKRSFRLGLLAFPIVVFLFFIFPRFHVGFWNRNNETGGQTGFSDRLRPGSISQLMQSDELIFRASFPNGESFLPSQLYWRGVTLGISRGLEWDRESDIYRYRPSTDRGDPNKSVIVQEIFMEPNSDKFLFALDWPSYLEFPNDRRKMRVVTSEGKSFELRQGLGGREYFTAYSYPLASEVPWQKRDFEEYLQVETLEESPLTREWLEGIIELNLKEEEKVSRVMDFLRENKFEYTLTPPKMASLDDFLFKSRKGFCEHYAGAVATLLRHLKVPTRVVVGFQGGKQSLMGDYWIVKSLDAHAWLELWSSRRQTWIRLDPTVVVAPTRISSGSEQLLSDLGRGPGAYPSLAWLESLIGSDLMKKFLIVQLITDQLELSWATFLLKYDFHYQMELLDDLGFNFRSRWVLLGLSALGLVVFLSLIYLFMIQSTHIQDPGLKVYRLLLKKLRKSGINKRPSEGPESLYARVVHIFPEQKSILQKIFSEVIELRYGEGFSTSERVQDLKGEIRHLNLPRKDIHAASAIKKRFKAGDSSRPPVDI